MPRNSLTACLTIGLMLCVLGALFTTKGLSQESLTLPDWTSIFNADGTVKDLNGGLGAVFMQENISTGIATDMTALFDSGYLESSFVYNGTVPTQNDLGNAYAYATLDSSGYLVLYAGVERLSADAGNTYIEFEFTQFPFYLRQGNPWPIHGTRTLDDLLVRVNFTAGIPDSMEIKRWTSDGYQTIQSAGLSEGATCGGSGATDLFCIGAPVAGLPPTNPNVWDLSYNPVTVPSADSFLEVGVNVGQLLDINPDISSITIRTPDDVVFGASFLTRGY